MTISTPERPVEYGALRKLAAWAVHFYTGLGLVVSAFILMLILDASELRDGQLVRGAFLLMLLATLIDATDGALARLVRVKSVLPGFEGRRLDDLIDFLNFTCLPLMLIWKMGLLPAGQEGWLLFALMASAYGFCQADAKTPDGYFLGFPSYWNVIAFYLYALQPLPAWVSLALVIVPGILTFVPLRYLYPTQKGRLNFVANLLAAPWGVLLFVILWSLPDELLDHSSPAGNTTQVLTLISLYYPLFYFVASWFVSAVRPVSRGQSVEMDR